MKRQVAELLGLDPDSPRVDDAVTHRSYRNENPQVTDNQRLEFLGDAVLDLCVAEVLYDRLPEADEGVLTRMRAQLVNAEALARWARTSALSEALRLGRGAREVADNTNVLADAVEALIAAAYLDGGLDGARRACRVVIAGSLDDVVQRGGLDAKSELQERVQALGLPLPTYSAVEARGDGFAVRVLVDGEELGRGEGRSKRLAQQAAAGAALAGPLLALEAQRAAAEAAEAAESALREDSSPVDGKEGSP